MKEIFKGDAIILFDAAMGTALHAAGQPAGVGSEEMNLLAPETVLRIHRENIEAGSDAITSNTFGVSQMMRRGEGEKAFRALEEGMKLARLAADSAIGMGSPAADGAEGMKLAGRAADGCAGRKAFACLCIGPTGALLGPLGDLSYEASEGFFALQAEAGERCGADFILLETFADLEEFVRAARAAKAASNLPVFGTMTFGESGRSFMGAAPADFVHEALDCGLAALGANCTLGPAAMLPVISEIIAETEKARSGVEPSPSLMRSEIVAEAEKARPGVHIIAQPNAGMPAYRDGRAVYEMTAEDFAAGAAELIKLGISGIGGCCGTTPAMIAAIRVIIDTKRADAP